MIIFRKLFTRVCKTKITPGTRPNTGPIWYDQECRHRRSLALKAGARVHSYQDKEMLLLLCKEYRACKQRKQRAFRNSIINEIEHAHLYNKSNIWKVLDRINNSRLANCLPEGHEFVKFFKNLSNPQTAEYFDMTHEDEAVRFLEKYDEDGHHIYENNNWQLDAINDNFTSVEIKTAIECLKNNKAPGMDCKPAEMIKYCKDILCEPLTVVFNYIIEQRDFPQCWAEGIRSSIYKAGRRDIAENYRGITILPIIEKIFEVAVYKRLTFVNEAFDKVDRYNGGFLNGSRTSDNIFIINGLIQRQLHLGKSLILCFVDFSKAFDLVNRKILFYKLVKLGWHGKVMDTLRSLYSKTSFRVKHKGWLSFLIENVMGVNQGGVASGLLFRKYLADLGNYLESEFGVCIGDIIIMHILWADDLILISDSVLGIQKQLDGLMEFCKKNHMIVNEIKTKCMGYGRINEINVEFNGKMIEQVSIDLYIKLTKTPSVKIILTSLIMVEKLCLACINGLNRLVNHPLRCYLICLMLL